MADREADPRASSDFLGNASSLIIQRKNPSWTGIHIVKNLKQEIPTQPSPKVGVLEFPVGL